MSFRIAVASSNGLDIDQHFGSAEKFYIYEVRTDGSYSLLRINSPPERLPCNGTEKKCCGCQGGTITADYSFLDGSNYVFAVKVGRNAERSLALENISAFSVETTVSEAVKKIAVYENRLNRFK